MQNKQAISFLFIANAISGVAQGISMIAIPWYFVSMMDLESEFGVLYLSITVFSIFWTLYSGTLIDRFDRKNIFLLMNAAGGLIVLSCALFGINMGMSPVLAGIVMTVTFLIYNIHFPTLYAFAQEITAPKDYGKITSYLEILHQSASVLAGGCAVFLLGGFNSEGIAIFERLGWTFSVEAWPLEHIFLLDGVTYFVALVILAMIRYKSVSEKKIETGSTLNRFRSGLKYLRANPMLLLFGSLSYGIFIGIMVIGFFLMPVYVEQFLEADVSTYAIFDIFFGGGAIFSGVLIQRIFKKTRPSMAVILMTFLASGIFFFLCFNENIALFYLSGLLLGLANAGSRIMRATFIFRHVPNTIIGRAGSVFHQYHIFLRIIFIGLFSLPFFMEGNHVMYAFLILGLFIMTSAILLLANYKKIISSGNG